MKEFERVKELQTEGDWLLIPTLHSLFVAEGSRVEKPIIWASRSGNRVLGRVGPTQWPLTLDSLHQTCQGNDFPPEGVVCI